MLIRVPESWPTPVVGALAMLLLAALDLAGSWAAKEAVVRSSPAWAASGLALFGVLFWVYASSLQYAELATVTLGWIVVLQTGIVLLDRYRFGTPMPRGYWLVVAVLLLAQSYLLLAPGRPPEG